MEHFSCGHEGVLSLPHMWPILLRETEALFVQVQRAFTCYSALGQRRMIVIWLE